MGYDQTVIMCEQNRKQSNSERTPMQHTATHCNTLQHAATHCNTQLNWPRTPWRASFSGGGLTPTTTLCCVASVLHVCCKCVASVVQVCCKCVALCAIHVCGSVLQCVAVCCKCVASVLQVRCSVCNTHLYTSRSQRLSSTWPILCHDGTATACRLPNLLI